MKLDKIGIAFVRAQAQQDLIRETRCLDYREGVKDCKTGIEARPGASIAYNDGYGAYYSLEQNRTHRSESY